jgi:DnaJ-class molecular chaperone
MGIVDYSDLEEVECFDCDGTGRVMAKNGESKVCCPTCWGAGSVHVDPDELNDGDEYEEPTP